MNAKSVRTWSEKGLAERCSFDDHIKEEETVFLCTEGTLNDIAVVCDVAMFR